MKKSLTILGGLYVCAFAAFFLFTGFNELLANGRPWLIGCLIFISLTALGVSGVFLGLKMDSEVSR